MKITIVAHPKSKRPRVEEDRSGTLHVYVSEPPLDDRANTAIAAALADHFHTNKRGVTLLSGQKAKTKTFQIETK